MIDRVTLFLTNGTKFFVSPCDAGLVGAHRWHAFSGRNTTYAILEMMRAGVRTRQYLHRFIMKPAAGLCVDHIDGDGLNNSRENLRVVTAAQNSRNRRKTVGATSSIYKGVTWDRDRRLWKAALMFERRHKYLGHFDTQEKAAAAYNESALNYFGHCANLNEVSANVG